jgi:integrase
MPGERGLFIKTLFQTGTRVSEFANLKAEDVFFDGQMILIAKAKGGKSRYVPIVPELAQALRTPIGQRTVGYRFKTHRATRYSPPTHPADSEGNSVAERLTSRFERVLTPECATMLS